jgi:chemotaxis methyl-accepting protein methylase
MIKPSSQNQHLNYLCNHITEKSGIGFDERKRKQLEEIVGTRCNILGLNHIRDYSKLLCTPSNKLNEFRVLMDIPTIRESFFFRHKAQFNALRYFCLPPLAAVTILDNIIRQDPPRAQAYFMLAMIHNNAGNLEQSSRIPQKGYLS